MVMPETSQLVIAVDPILCQPERLQPNLLSGADRLGKIIAQGQTIFGVVMVALGVVNFFCAHFGLTIAGVPWIPANPLFCYLCGAVLVSAGTSIAANFRSRSMAMLLGYFFLGCVLFRALP